MVYKASLIFDHAHQIIIKLLAFLNLYQHAKIIFEIEQILESETYKTTLIFDHNHPKIIKVTFGFPEFLLTHQKNQFIPLIPSSDTASFGVLRIAWPHPFLTTVNPIFFN